MSSFAPLDILIVGGGPTGLATAISVTLAGHKATVFERSSQPHTSGSGLQCTPNGTRLLLRWGLEDILGPAITSPVVQRIHNIDGTPVGRREVIHDNITHRYGFPMWTFHRVDLQTALVRRAAQLGVNIRFLAYAISLDPHQPKIYLANGDSHCGDLVVVADGTWSALRSQVFQTQFVPTQTGETAYRMTISRAKVEDRDVLQLMDLAQIQVWVGEGTYAIGYPIKDGAQFSVLLVSSYNLVADSRDITAVIEELKTLVTDWDPVFTAMLKSLQRVNKWHLMQVPPLTTMVSAQDTYVVAGDCCRFIKPLLGQNLNLGLEDAATLGCLLGYVRSRSQLPKALSTYNNLRRDRGRNICQETNSVGSGLHFNDNEFQESQVAGFDVGFIPVCDMKLIPFENAQERVWSFDAYAEVEKAYLKSPY